MTIVPCAPSPGLELFDWKLDNWVSVESFLHPNEDVVVFCDQYLEDVSLGAYGAAIHRVGKGTSPRLSLVYEMRPRTTNKR
jgi:isopenicillin N synthase-like dioxygenase